MPDFTRFLTNDIAEIAEDVHPYIDELYPTLLIKAVEQMIQNDGLDLGENLNTVLQHLGVHLNEGKKVKVKDLIEETNGQDFKWPLYDKCVAFCERENIESVGLAGIFYHEEDIEMPQTMMQAVGWLTVAEMKEYLREYGQKVSGKRTELEQRMVEHVALDNLRKELLIKYDEMTKGAYLSYLANKYERLVIFISHRAYFLRSLGKSYYQYKIVPMKGNDKISDLEKALAKEVSEGGYDTVLVDGKLAKLLPLFPGSSFNITTDVLGTPNIKMIAKGNRKAGFVKRLLSSFRK